MAHPPFASRLLKGAAFRLLAAFGLALVLTVPFPRAWAADAAGLKTTTWVTEEYYPYNYKEGDTVRGVSADLLRLVWKELGLEEQSIYILPWARAYKQALGTPGMALFSTARTPDREALFKWAGPIAHVRFVLAAPLGSGLHIEKPQDLAGLRVGTQRDDVAENLLAPWRSICRIENVANMEQNLRKVDAGRLDLVAYEEASLRLLLRRLGRDPYGYETIYVLEEIPVYYAFNHAIDDELVNRFQQALDAAKSSEAYTLLLHAYLR